MFVARRVRTIGVIFFWEAREGEGEREELVKYGDLLTSRDGAPNRGRRESRTVFRE